MPELTAIEFGLLGIVLVLGLVLGWILRGNRSGQEKIAINAGWQEQIAAQRSEHDRLAVQNKSLMEQISENQASHKDSKMRAQELSTSLKETFERRDELQRQIKDVRGNLENVIVERDRLQSDFAKRSTTNEPSSNSLKEKDDKIFYLSRELQSWQDRVPPLVERFRIRDLEAQELEAELQKATQRLDALEKMVDQNETRIDPVGSNAITDGLDASNDQYDETSEHDTSELGDQIDEQSAVTSHDMEESAVNGLDTSSPKVDLDVSELDHLNNSDTGESDHQATDDLRLIRGVGPAIEKTLNNLGIFRFNQISEMSEYDIDRVAQQLKGFRSRIYREDWVGQARMLQQQKNSETT